MMFLPCGMMFLTTFAAAEPSPPRATLDELAAEAQTQQSRHPERWRQYQRQAEHVFAENARVTAQWRKRSAPPRPDLAPLRLPLAFLIDGLLREEPSNALPQGKPVRFGDRWRRHSAYLLAVVHSADARRIPALLEYRDRYGRLWPKEKYRYAWGKLIAEAATARWAAARIPELARGNPRLDLAWPANDLLYCLIDRFAGQLPPDEVRVAYDYLRKQARDRLATTEDEQLWDVLFRLDTPRARKDILPHFAKPNGFFGYNTYVVGLLFRHAGPSPEVAAAVRRWLASGTGLDDFHKRQLREVLLRSDPANEVEPTARYIDRLLAEQKRKNARFEFGGDVHGLVLALGDVRTRAADDLLARYVFERAIDVGVRFLLLEALVKHRYPKAPALAARWLAEEPEHMRRWLREQASGKWGPYGREVLREAEHLKGRLP